MKLNKFLNEVRRDTKKHPSLKMFNNLGKVIESFQVEINDSIKDIFKTFKDFGPVGADITKIINDLDKLNSPLANIRGKIKQLK